SPPWVVVGRYVEELTEAAGARFPAALASGTLDCRSGLDFLRRWIERGGFSAAQLGSSRSLAAACPDLPEARFYLARAADIAGDVVEASSAYARRQPG